MLQPNSSHPVLVGAVGIPTAFLGWEHGFVFLMPQSMASIGLE